MKKLTFLLFFIGIFIGLVGSLLTANKPELRETLTFFPVDDQVSYQSATTKLSLLQLNDENEYTLKWELSSSLDKVTNLRHDISLLFEDGVLREKISKWEENIESLYEKKEVRGEDSGHFETISFHHSENHYPNDDIKSSQRMSYDQIYIIDSPLRPLHSFRSPGNEEEVEWQKLLDNIINQQLHHVWKELIQHYNVPTDKYHLIPLTLMYEFNDKPLPNLTQEQTTVMIGALWETLYKEYFLGVKKNDGTVVEPIGSSVPLVLFHQSGSHFIVVLETFDGEKIQLIGNLTF